MDVICTGMCSVLHVKMVIHAARKCTRRMAQQFLRCYRFELACFQRIYTRWTLCAPFKTRAVMPIHELLPVQWSWISIINTGRHLHRKYVLNLVIVESKCAGPDQCQLSGLLMKSTNQITFGTHTHTFNSKQGLIRIILFLTGTRFIYTLIRFTNLYFFKYSLYKVEKHFSSIRITCKCYIKIFEHICFK